MIMFLDIMKQEETWIQGIMKLFAYHAKTRQGPLLNWIIGISYSFPTALSKKPHFVKKFKNFNLMFSISLMIKREI